jgi:hypothetical protein
MQVLNVIIKRYLDSYTLIKDLVMGVLQAASRHSQGLNRWILNYGLSPSIPPLCQQLLLIRPSWP